MAEARRVLVLAPNWLGDAVMALPAIDDFHRLHAGAELVVAARRSVAQLFTMVPQVSAIVELEWGGGARQLSALRRDVQRLRALGADTALLLPNSFASALLVRLAGVPQRCGYNRDGRGWLLTRAVAPPPAVGRESLSRDGASGAQKSPPPQSVSAPPGDATRWPRPVDSAGPHQGAYYQHLVRALGAANGPLTPRVVVSPASRAAAGAVLAEHGWREGTPLVVFAPGAAYGTAKRWWPSHFSTLATTLVAREGAWIVLVGSTADLATTNEVSGAVPDAQRTHVLNLAGRTDLPTLAGIMSLADACVSNDSGAMHVAAAAGVPLAALFGPTNEHETAPLTHTPMTLLLHDVPCRPCMLRECPIDHPCMRDLAPDTVLTAVQRLLATGRAATNGARNGGGNGEVPSWTAEPSR